MMGPAFRAFCRETAFSPRRQLLAAYVLLWPLRQALMVSAISAAPIATLSSKGVLSFVAPWQTLNPARTSNGSDNAGAG
jgi:hypothetical protein